MGKMRVGDRVILRADLYETLLDDFPDIVHSVDQNGMIVFTNKKAEELLGYSREELLSMSIRDIYAPEILHRVDSGFAELKDEGNVSVESVLVSRDGTRIPVEIRSFGLYDADGEFQRTFSIIRDLRQIKQLQDSLVHTSRLAAIGEMAAGIAHDINNPLAVVMAALELSEGELEKHPEPTPEVMVTVRSMLEQAGRGAAAIEGLAEQLLAFSHDMAGEEARMDLREVIDDSLFLTQSRIKKGSFLVDDAIPHGTHFTIGASNQIQQLFVNLISNAADAMSETKDGTLRLSISPVTRDGADFWRCDVSDTGTGIPEDVVERVFDSFFTTKERGEGTGLGLSISRGIITEHEGMIEIDSQPGVGTTFSVYLKQEKNSP